MSRLEYNHPGLMSIYVNYYNEAAKAATKYAADKKAANDKAALIAGGVDKLVVAAEDYENVECDEHVVASVAKRSKVVVAVAVAVVVVGMRILRSELAL